MEKNKTGKYLKYAIGEIVLVMVGILLALQVNNWNEERKQDIIEKEVVSGIKNDLTKDKENIKTIIQLAEDKNSIYTILNQKIFDYYDYNRQGLDSLLRQYFKAQRTFYPISGSYQSAISGNELSKFKNKDFSSAVIELYNSTYSRLIDNSNIVDNKWHYLTQKYSQIRRTGEIPDMNESELTEFLNDVSYHMFSMNYYKQILSASLVEIDTLLSKY